MNPSIAYKSKIKFGIGGEEDMTFETHAAFSTIEFLG
jgi:hypothetical protein